MNPIPLRPLALALTLAVSSLFAEEPFSFEKTPGKLPKGVIPKSYRVVITPDVEARTFQGLVKIDVHADQAVQTFVLNSLGLTITKASLDPRNQHGVAEPRSDALPQLAVALDEKNQTLTLTPPKELPGQASYRLVIEFKGKLTEQPQGLFLTRYATALGEKRALMTQFEATDARRMFPCWDEPVFRAKFQLTVAVPESYVAISNMPVEREEKLLGGVNGLKQIAFAETPPMASYLLAFCAGEFETLEDEVDGIKLRVLTTAGKREQARYALEATKKIVPYYNEYFGTKFPLPKLDQVSFASTGSSGMENWGCITYNDTAFLYDPASSSEQTKERVFAVVAHEIAHQWFGDLVTMAWWDNLWLNEGFASWMGTKATDHFNPQWKHWLRAAGAKEAAMRLDARATTHPIQQHVENEAQAEDVFDEITYSKGQSFLRMLEAWLGEDKFRDGLRVYMKRHAYGNTTTANLWAALGESSGQDVAGMAAGWTEQPGFPLVNFAKLGPNRFRVSQERFTVHQDKPQPLTWKVPVTFEGSKFLGASTLQSGAQKTSTAQVAGKTILLEAAAQEIALGVPDAGSLKGNNDGAGYYRTAYDAELFADLTRHLDAFGEADKLNLLNDTWALVTAARAPVTTYLDLVQALGKDTSPTILDNVAGKFGQIDFLARGAEGRVRFHEWTRTFLRPHFARLGWDAKPGDSPLDGMLRATLIGLLGDFGDPDVEREARARWEKFLKDPATLTGDLRRAVLNIVARDADDATYEKLHDLAKRETSTEQKRLLYGALARSRNPQHADKTLALALTDELVPQAATYLVLSVAREGEQPERAWQFAQPHLDALFTKLSSNKSNTYVPNIFDAFTDSARADELEAFAKAHLPPESQYGIAKGADEIRFHAELKARILPAIDAWCRAQAVP